MRMHRIRAGGAIATNRIASVLNIDFEAAELKKQNLKKSDVDFSDIKRAHDSSYERAFREFSQVLKEHELTTGVQVPTVYLAGGGAMFPGVDTLLKDIVGKDVVRANPFAKVAYPAFMKDTLTDIGPSFVVALGAAIRSFE
jgi:Tfp pilus assembly PilM family ATPase